MATGVAQWLWAGVGDQIQSTAYSPDPSLLKRKALKQLRRSKLSTLGKGGRDDPEVVLLYQPKHRPPISSCSTPFI